MAITPFGWTQATSIPVKTVSPFTQKYLRTQDRARQQATPDFRMNDSVKHFMQAAQDQYLDNMAPQGGWLTQPGAKRAASEAFTNQYKPVGGLWPQVPQGLLNLASQQLMSRSAGAAQRSGLPTATTNQLMQSYLNNYVNGMMSGDRMGQFNMNQIFNDLRQNQRGRR